MSELTSKQKRFIDEYLTDFNATQAAIRAGYSKKTAPEQASRLLTNVKIKEIINSELSDIHERQKKTLVRASEKAIDALLDVVNNGGLSSARVSAAIAVLDRAGHKPIDHIKADINNQNAIDEIPLEKKKEALYDAAESFGAIVSRPSGAK